ncbi:MAG: SufE family protein [Muribaculaceae bacterium]|nr:SufE family protein [Muribaculaceae bacterium]
MKSIEETQEEIVDEFNSVDDWMDRYTMIIDEGSTLPPLPEKYRTPSNLIEGCQSRVWINAELTPEGRIHFEADSDAMIVKGIIALLVKVLDDRTPDEVINADLHFINDIGLSENLSPTRSNGLLAMLKQMRLYALAFKTKQNS